jgi:transposase
VGSSYSGVLSCDDFTTYNVDPVKAEHKCQAHLLPHFKKLIKISGLNHQAIGTQLIDLIDEGFKNYVITRLANPEIINPRLAIPFTLWGSLIRR